MNNELYEYEQKLLDEVAHSRFSWSKLINILKLDAIAGSNR